MVAAVLWLGLVVVLGVVLLLEWFAGSRGVGFGWADLYGAPLGRMLRHARGYGYDPIVAGDVDPLLRERVRK